MLMAHKGGFILVADSSKDIIEPIQLSVSIHK
jgi:hypothetical protein